MFGINLDENKWETNIVGNIVSYIGHTRATVYE